MKQKLKSKFAIVALAMAAAAPSAKADGIDDAVTAMATLATDVGGGTAAVIGVAVVFVGLKLGKRLLGKV